MRKKSEDNLPLIPFPTFSRSVLASLQMALTSPPAQKAFPPFPLIIKHPGLEVAELQLIRFFDKVSQISTSNALRAYGRFKLISATLRLIDTSNEGDETAE